LVDSSLLNQDDVPPFELKGNYQNENKKTAYAALKQLQKLGWNISEENIRSGFSLITKNTGLLGRWQVLNNLPLTIADVAHNEDGVRWIVSQLKEMDYRHLHFVIGVVNDKDINAILSLLPKEAIYYFCKANIPRGLDADLLHWMLIYFNSEQANFI